MTGCGFSQALQGEAQSSTNVSALWNSTYAEVLPDLSFFSALKGLAPELLYAGTAFLGMVVVYRALPSVLRRFDGITEQRTERVFSKELQCRERLERIEERLTEVEQKGTRLEEHLAHVSKSLEGLRLDFRDTRIEAAKALEQAENRLMSAIQLLTRRDLRT